MKQEIRARIDQIRQGIVPDGYTKTRSEITPTTWTPACLGEIYTERKEPGNESLPLLTVSIHSGVSDGELDEDELPKKVKRIEDKSQYKRAATGDLVFNMMRAWQGAIGTVRTEGMVSPAYIVAKPNGKVYPPFMDYYMKAPRMVGMINRQSYGVTDFRKRLYWDSFAPIPCVLPPVREQKKIAEILATQDKAIELQGRKIEELKRFKQGCLEKMFPRKGQKVPEKRFPGFTDDWEQRKLVSLCEKFTDGDWIEAKDQSHSGVRLIQTGNVGSGEYIDKPSNKKWISEETFGRLNCEEVFAGDILISRLPEPAGRACIVPNLGTKMITAVDCTIVRTATKTNSKYLLQFLSSQSYFDEVNTCLVGGTRQRISRSNLAAFDVPMPAKYEEQKAIGEFLCDIDNLITLHQRKLDEMKKQKKALMQLLLTGIVRV